MRQIKTFILRFYTDTEQREQFCGELRPVQRQKAERTTLATPTTEDFASNKAMPFKNAPDLLALLHRLVNKDVSDGPAADLQDEIAPVIT